MQFNRVIRKETRSNTDTAFEFGYAGLGYLVKNFTSGDIYVGFSPDTAKENRMLIPPDTAQTITGQLIEGSTLYVLAEESDERGVEIICTRW